MAADQPSVVRPRRAPEQHVDRRPRMMFAGLACEHGSLRSDTQMSVGGGDIDRAALQRRRFRRQCDAAPRRTGFDHLREAIAAACRGVDDDDDRGIEVTR
jgi:hypothetical protein